MMGLRELLDALREDVASTYGCENFAAFLNEKNEGTIKVNLEQRTCLGLSMEKTMLAINSLEDIVFGKEKH